MRCSKCLREFSWLIDGVCGECYEKVGEVDITYSDNGKVEGCRRSCTTN
jgi:hypothetical protein